MAVFPLLRSQKNDVFQAIKSDGLNVYDFKWEDVNSIKRSASVERITHKGTGYYFLFDFDGNNNRHSYYCPDREKVAQVHSEPLSWGGQLKTVIRWLENIKKEITVPDLWLIILEEATITNTVSDRFKDNKAFTDDEQKYIIAQVKEIGKYIIDTHKLQEEHSQYVKKQLEYLAQASKRIGRKDWYNIANSVLINITVELFLKGDAARELFRIATSLLGKLFTGNVLPLP